MPNQFFYGGYYGYPYPQQNMFAPTGEPYSPYPYINAGMQPYSYMPNAAYIDPSYAQQQYGYAPPMPYGASQPPLPASAMPGMNASYGPMPTIPPAYTASFMQPYIYGMAYPQQPYGPNIQQGGYDPQYAQFMEQGKQYWQDYQPAVGYPAYSNGNQVNAYANQNPLNIAPNAAYPSSDVTGEFEKISDQNPASAEIERSRQEALKAAKERRETEQKHRAARKRQEDLRQKAAMKEAKLNQQKARSAQEAAQNKALRQKAAQAEHDKQVAAQQQAARQQLIQQQASQQQQQSATQQDDAVTRQANPRVTPANAAAAASIAAFHEAAKSVNEINLSNVTDSIKPKPSLNLESLDIDFNPGVRADEDTFDSGKGDNAISMASETVVESIPAKDANENIDGEDAPELTSVEKGDIPVEPLAVPNAEDVVIVEEEKAVEVVPKDSEDNNGVVEKTEDLSAVLVDAEESKDEKSNERKEDEPAESGKPDDSKEDDTLSAPSKTSNKAPMSPAAIVGLVFGIVAVGLACATPFFNLLGYGALCLGIISVIVSAVAIYATRNKRRSGKPAAIIGVVLGVAAIIAAIVMHMLLSPSADVESYSNSEPSSAILGYMPDSESNSDSDNNSPNDADASGVGSTGQSSSSTTSPYSNGGSGLSTNSGDSGSSASSLGSISSMEIKPSGAHEDLTSGTPVTYSNGLVVSVDKLESGLTNNAGNPIICVTVTYKNNGTSNLSYNSFDWKVEDDNGSLHTYAIYPNGENELNSGELTPGQSVTGNLYFEGPVKKIIYEADYWNSDSNATWKA